MTSELNRNKIRRLDMTSLLVFEALTRLGRATDVAEVLGLTNSAISHAITRLRDVFEDDLFVRHRQGLKPTTFAYQVYPYILMTLDNIDSALNFGKVFEPTISSATIRIVVRDRELTSDVATKMLRLNNLAPKLQIVVLDQPKRKTLDLIRDGQVDLAIGFFPDLDGDFSCHPLRSESYLVAGRKGHPYFMGSNDLDNYCAQNHILVSTDGTTHGIVDTQLEATGRKRSVRVSLPYFLSALSLVESSDLLGTFPQTLVYNSLKNFSLDYWEPPLEIRPFDVQVVTRKSTVERPVLSWFVKQLTNS